MEQEGSIRHADPRDYDHIVSVMDEWWQRPIASILPRLFLDHFFATSLVAVDSNSNIIGFLVGFPSPARREESYVHAIAVSPENRTTGLGYRLYGHFFENSRADGRHIVRAITSPSNSQSIAFHRKLGFAVSDVVADYDGPGDDRVCFRIDLS